MHNIQPLLTKNYPKASRAEGVYIFDAQGKRYLDASSGAVTCSLGHSHPQVIAAMKQQLDKLQFVYRSQFGTEEAEQLATRLCELSAGQVYQHAFFVNSGTEAIETAMKIAWQYWQEKGKPSKVRFISRRKSYHGITTGALSLSGHQLRRQRFENLLEKYPALLADLEKDTLETQVSELESVIAKWGADQIAAFVAEPVVGAAGTAIHPGPEYYRAMKAVCEANQILFIADEVMTGLGRTGTWFGLDHWNTTADIAAVGKSLGAGYAPIAATLMTSAVLEPIRNGSGLIMSGHTYSGHPLSCATASKVLEVIATQKLLQNVGEKGAWLLQAFHSLRSTFPALEQVRGKGLLIGLEFSPDRKGLQAKLIEKCFENGLLVYPSVGGKQGTDENGILVSPPYILSQQEATELVEKLETSLKQLV